MVRFEVSIAILHVAVAFLATMALMWLHSGIMIPAMLTQGPLCEVRLPADVAPERPGFLVLLTHVLPEAALSAEFQLAYVAVDLGAIWDFAIAIYFVRVGFFSRRRLWGIDAVDFPNRVGIAVINRCWKEVPIRNLNVTR